MHVLQDCQVTSFVLIKINLSFVFDSGVLSRLKIVCLENEKREAKRKYSDSQKMYVKEMLGRPMEKLHVRTPI